MRPALPWCGMPTRVAARNVEDSGRLTERMGPAMKEFLRGTDSQSNLWMGEVNAGQRYYRYRHTGMGPASSDTETR